MPDTARKQTAGGVGVSPAIRDRAQFEEIRAELETTPYLARRRELMDCGDLHEVVAEIVSGKLAREISDTRLPRRELRAILWATLRGDERVGADIAAIVTRDPSATSYLQAVTAYKGFHAVQAQRCAHAFWRRGGFENDHVAFAIQDRVNELFAVDMHPGAFIGGGCFVDHATNIVIGETATLGRDCTILHGVTLGGTGKARTTRHPQIGNRVTLNVGATVVGPITLGDDVVVSAQAVLSVDVPAGMTVVGTNTLLDPSERPCRDLAREDPETWPLNPALHVAKEREAAEALRRWRALPAKTPS